MMIAELTQFFKRQKQNVSLAIVVFLLVLLAFGAGMVAQFYLSKPPLVIETPAEQ